MYRYEIGMAKRFCLHTHRFIESLSRLNHMLQSSGSDKTVVAFIITNAKTTNYTVDSLRGQATNKLLQDTVAEIKTKLGQKLFDTVTSGNLPNSATLLDASDIVKLKRCLYANQHPTLPPVVTHNVINDHKDPVLQHVRRVCLFNDRTDRVKIIFHPEFLNSSRSDGSWNVEDEKWVCGQRRGEGSGLPTAYYRSTAKPAVGCSAQTSGKC